MKSEGAFRTIGELSADLGVQQHVLRYWETRFPQLRPIQRAGNRRYYRPSDVALARRIHQLLSEQGYTVKGVQRLLAAEPDADVEPTPAMLPLEPPARAPAAAAAAPARSADTAELRAIRNLLAAALEA